MTDAAAMPLGDAALGPAERLHPLYLVTGLGKSLRGAWGLIAGGVVLGSQGRWFLAALIGVAFVAVSVGSLLLKWLKLEYRVGAHELRIDSGFLSRTSRAIPFDRVTDVDLEQGPLHRLFGLARVRLETGASAGAKNEDGVLDAIALGRAEALREHIRARRGQAAAPAIEQDADTAPLFAMDKRRVAIAGLFNFSLAVLAGLFGVTQTMGDVIGFDPFKRAFWIDVLDRVEPARDVLVAHQFVAAIGGSILLILIGSGTGIVRTLLREHGFRLDRTDTGLRRRRGLVTLTDVTIPARRIQAAIVGSGPIRRALGWCELKLQSLAMDGAKGDHVVAPLARPGEAAAILASLGWPALPIEASWRPVSRAHVTSFAAIMAPALLIALAAIAFIGPIVLLWVVGAALAVAVRWLDWRHTRYALSGASLFVEAGWWRRRRAIVPTAKIQSVELSENFWSRAFGICALRLGVAGGGGFSAHVVPALSRQDAEALRTRLVAAR
ncbi:MAG: PH domain-containing protein [Sphingomicrobium sp.]